MKTILVSFLAAVLAPVGVARQAPAEESPVQWRSHVFNTIPARQNGSGSWTYSHGSSWAFNNIVLLKQ